MAVETKEIVAVLEAVLSYLNITLPCQQLSPDAEMGREALLGKVQTLADRLNETPNSPEEVLTNDEEIYDDVVGSGGPVNTDDTQANRQSCYIDMQLPENNLDVVDGSITTDQLSEAGDYEVTEGPPRQNREDLTNQQDTLLQDTDYEVPESPMPNKQSLTNQQETLMQDENYEVPGQQSDVVELTEEDEEYDDVNNILSSEDNDFELTEDLLLQKLRNLENTGPKSILCGSRLSGVLQKLKKKNFLSKWHKRYCILREQFLFYYHSESDSKSLGVIVLPGYIISEEKTSSKDKFIFKLVPPGKGRSTYLFQVSSKPEYDAWLSALKSICCQKLNRLSSDAFNRVAKKMDEESEEGSGGEPIKPTIPEEEDASEEQYDDCIEGQVDEEEGECFYEELGVTQQPLAIPPRTVQNIAPPPIPSPSLPPRLQNPPAAPADDALYDDHVDLRDDMAQQPAAVPADDMYEGIPGENYEPESSQIVPVQEDIYEDIGPFQQNTTSAAAPPPPTSLPPSLNQGPSLPARRAIIGEKRPVPPGIGDSQQLSSPPPIPGRNERKMVTRTESKEPGTPPPPIPSRNGKHEEVRTEPVEPDQKMPSEDDFSYANVYIGTKSYAPTEADELPFKRGDPIYILQKVNANWWVGCMDQKVGLVPSSLLIAGFAH